MNRPEIQTTAQTATDGACSDPLCAYRAEIEMGYWVEPNTVLLRDTPEDRERLIAAIVRGSQDVAGWAPEEADAIIAALRGSHG